MYNGIGLLTPRGSGTSGYVSANKFNLRGPPQLRTEPPRDGPPKHKAANKDILDHKKKREVEVKVEQERERLEAEG
jgi:serine/arginine repetitive matrix protein 2